MSKYKMSELSCGNLTFIKGVDAVFASQCRRRRHFNRMEQKNKKAVCNETITSDFDVFTKDLGLCSWPYAPRHHCPLKSNTIALSSCRKLLGPY